ncbi:unnamed protein product [Alopecurus aequalis]
MEGCEDSEWATEGNLNRRGADPALDEMYQAVDLSVEIVSQISALEKKTIAIGRPDSTDHKALLELKSGALKFQDDICGLTNYERKKRDLLMETGGGSTGRSGGESPQQHKSSKSEIKHDKSSLPAVLRVGGSKGGYSSLGYLSGLVPELDSDERQDPSLGKPGDEVLEETIHILAGAIMFKYEAEGRDLAGMLEVEKTREEVEVALKFGFSFGLLGKHIDELRHELRGIVSSFSPENKDVLTSMTMLAREPCLHGVAKLGWISDLISRLRRMDLDLDSEVKSTKLKLKAESYLSSLKKEERSGSEGVAGDKTTFAAYRLCWERTWGSYSFENQTLLSPMQFTHCIPSRVPVDAVTGSTMQIYSIKVSTKGAIKWPLNVYGVVAARDSVDRQRNPLFIRTRNYCQVLTKEVPFLRLTGPVRAIVSMGTVYIETELKAKAEGGRKSEDVELASTVINSYKGDNFSTLLADNNNCTIELCFEELEQSVQATVVSVVVKSKTDSLPFQYGGKILCCSLAPSGNGDFAGISSRQAVVFDSANGKVIKDRHGHLDLSRRVFSVELKGKLQFHIQPYSQSDSAEIDAQVLLFTPSEWNITEEACCLVDGTEVEITVAWSLIPSKMLT